MKSFFTSLFILVSIVASAQPAKIGSDKELKETLAMIKSKMPYIKNNLTVEKFGQRVPNFKMGKAVVSFEESKTAETISIRFSAPIYYSGTVEEFRNYYNEVVKMTYDLYKNIHDTSSSVDGSKWVTSFYQKYQTKAARSESILIKLVGTIDPWLTISFLSHKENE